MKRMRTAALLTVITLGSLALAAPAVLMSIQTRDATLRAQPSPFGKPVGQIPYAERVTVLAENGPWTQVRTPEGLTGWISKNSLTPKQILLRAGASDVQAAATDQEVSLAGKGFNKEVEAEYRARNPNLSFAEIDRLEKIKIPEAELLRFLKEGGLQTGGAQ